MPLQLEDENIFFKDSQEFTDVSKKKKKKEVCWGGGGNWGWLLGDELLVALDSRGTNRVSS